MMRVGRKSFSLSTHTATFTRRASATGRNDNSTSQQTRFWLTKSEIVKLRAKAIRRGIWFKVLTKAERAYIELTIKVLNKVRSYFLAKVLTSIIRRLLNALESNVAHLARKVGQSLAQKLSRIAQNWGNISALNWAKEPVFTRYLSVMHINTVGTFMV